MFETSGKINTQSLQKLFKEMMPAWYKIIQIFPVILLFIMAAYTTSKHMVMHAGIYLIFAMLFLTLTRGKIKNEAAKMLKRMKKITGKDIPEYLTRFEEDGVYTEAVETNYAAVVPYKDIVKILTTHEYIILFTKKNENIFVFKNQLDTTQITNLHTFLKSRNSAL